MNEFVNTFLNTQEYLNTAHLSAQQICIQQGTRKHHSEPTRSSAAKLLTIVAFSQLLVRRGRSYTKVLQSHEPHYIHSVSVIPIFNPILVSTRYDE